MQATNGLNGDDLVAESYDSTRRFDPKPYSGLHTTLKWSRENDGADSGYHPRENALRAVNLSECPKGPCESLWFSKKIQRID